MSNQKNIRCAVAGLISETNFGDRVIAECAKWLYEEPIKAKYKTNVKWVPCDLDLNKVGLKHAKANHLWQRFRSKLFSACRRYEAKVALLAVALAYIPKVHHCKVGIVAGGGLVHYKYLNCAYGLCAFVVACKLCHVPVIVNAVGVEGFDAENIKCQLLRWCLNFSNVIAISSRDDAETLRNMYLARGQIADSIADPAVFSRCLLRTPPEKRFKLGIGLMRKGPFADIGNKDYESELVSFYSDLAQECERQGISYEFFINGWSGDLVLVPKIEKTLGHSIKVNAPKDSAELIATIAGYSKIVSARMHSLIIAYSCNVPAMAILWHNKVRLWLGKVGGVGQELKALSVSAVIDFCNDESLVSYSSVERKTLEESTLRFVQNAISRI